MNAYLSEFDDQETDIHSGKGFIQRPGIDKSATMSKRQRKLVAEGTDDVVEVEKLEHVCITGARAPIPAAGTTLLLLCTYILSIIRCTEGGCTGFDPDLKNGSAATMKQTLRDTNATTVYSH